MRRDIVIVDYKIGNVQSVYNAVYKLGYRVAVSGDKKIISNAECVILPGVGAFEVAMKNLVQSDLKNHLDELVLVKKKPILGICLGMQIMADSSEENGLHKGLGWIKGNVIKLKLPEEYNVPHVGWNIIEITNKSQLFTRLKEYPSFYFDHSYHFKCRANYIAATCEYGEKLVAAIQHENIFGVQFHPEKSQNSGLKLFRGLLSHFIKS